MSVKKSKKPKFTVQVRVVLVLDVEVEGGNLEESITLGKNWKRSDLVTQLDDAVTVADERYSVVGAWGNGAWNAEQS